MAERKSETHEHVVVKQDNGELQEDVVSSSHIDGGRVDEQVDDSFPASDPPSNWSGPPEESEASQRTRRRMVHRRPAEHPPERTHPAEPKPQTLRKD